MNFSNPLLKIVALALLNTLRVLASDDMGRGQNDSDGHGSTRLANAATEGGEKDRPHISCIRLFAESLDEHAESHRAAKRYAEAMTHRKEARLSGHISIETRIRDFTAGEPALFPVRVPFRPIKTEKYEWAYAVFETDIDGSNYTVKKTGGGIAMRNTVFSLDITARSEKPGDYGLLLLLFGRALPDGKFDLLDYRKLQYTVRPAMR